MVSDFIGSQIIQSKVRANKITIGQILGTICLLSNITDQVRATWMQKRGLSSMTPEDEVTLRIEVLNDLKLSFVDRSCIEHSRRIAQKTFRAVDKEKP